MFLKFLFLFVYFFLILKAHIWFNWDFLVRLYMTIKTTLFHAEILKEVFPFLVETRNFQQNVFT